MSEIETYDDVVRWSCDPDHNGRIHTADPRRMRILLDGMIARPGSSGTMYPDRAWGIIAEHGLMLDFASSGWLTRDGTMLGAGYAAHERLLTYLDIIAADAEAMGWARISRRGFKCGFRITGKQRNRIEDLGLLVDDGEERLKPKFKAPGNPRNPFAGILE